MGTEEGGEKQKKPKQPVDFLFVPMCMAVTTGWLGQRDMPEWEALSR